MKKITVKRSIMSEEAGQTVEIVQPAIGLFVPRSDVVMEVISGHRFFYCLFCLPDSFVKPLFTMHVSSITNSSFYICSYQMSKVSFKNFEVGPPACRKRTIGPDYLPSCTSSSNLIRKSSMLIFVAKPAFPKWSSRFFNWTVLSINTEGPIMPVSLKPHVKVNKLYGQNGHCTNPWHFTLPKGIFVNTSKSSFTNSVE